MSDFVLVRYALYADDELVETNDPEIKADVKDKPLLVKLGDGFFPAKVEESLKENDSVEIELSKEENPYGDRDVTLIKQFSTRDLTRRLGHRPKVGEVILVGNFRGVVILVDRQRTLVDFNHPLAGKKLKYVVKVVKRIEDDKELVKRLIYQACDEIKPDEVEIDDSWEITLPKGRLRCPNVDAFVVQQLKRREKLREMTRKKPVKPERLEKS